MAKLKKCPKCPAKFRSKRRFKEHYIKVHEKGAKWAKDW